MNKITDIEIEDIEESKVSEVNEVSNGIAWETNQLIIKKRIDEVMARMEGLEIDSYEKMQEAAEWLNKNKETQKFVKDFYEPERKRTYDAYTTVTDAIKRFTDILAKGEKIIKRKMADYQIEQERIRQEEERKRIASEEAARKKAEKKGGPVPQFDITPILEPEKVEGVSFVENWTFDITDKAKIPMEYMIPDEKKIRGVVKAMKGDTNIPGIRVFADKTVRSL